MCGIAGYSLSPESRVDRTRAAQTLLAAIAERGADAAGYAYREPGRPVRVHKQRSGASALLDRIELPPAATQVLLHVRDYTKGHPRIDANNHPIRHGDIVGVHNGIIFNDDEIFAAHGFVRAAPGMTVDSEAIFALVERARVPASRLEKLRGSMAAAWLDEERPELLFVARGVGRPLWLGEGSDETFFASTRQALEIAERYAGVRLEKRELEEGTLVALAGGRAVCSEPFEPDRAFQEDHLPPIRAPEEGAFCLEWLAGLSSA